MADDVTNVRVILERIHVIDDEDWSGVGELYFEGSVGGQRVDRSRPVKAGSGRDINLTGPAWSKVIDVRGRDHFDLELRGFDEDVFADDSLGIARARIAKNGAGEWPAGDFHVTAANPGDFTVHYHVEPILALDPGRPETAVVCREHGASPRCSTISGVAVRVRKIKATVLSTVPLTARAAPAAVANAWAAPTDLVFESTKQLPRAAVAFSAADFATPKALVLVRNSAGPIQLEAETDPPNVDVHFLAIRASDDAAAVGAAAQVPTITQTGNNTATMATDQRGSFFVLAYVDTNRNQQRDINEQGVILPVVLAECRIEAAADLRSTANPGNLNIAFDGVAGNVDTANYHWVGINTGDFNSQATAGVALDADVRLVGGGADGKRGLDRVFLGWANNFTALTYDGLYRDGRHIRRVQVDNAAAATGAPVAGLPLFVSGGPTAPNPIAFPPSLLDTGRNAGAGQDPLLGGLYITFTRSAENPVAPPAAAPGEKRHVIARDSPGWFYNRHHDDPARHTRLRSFVHNLASTTFLVAWTNTTGGNTPTPATANSVGFRTFTVIAETRWTVSATFNITGASPHIGLTQTGAAPTITANNVDHSPGVTPAAAGMEVRPPTTLGCRAIDAST